MTSLTGRLLISLTLLLSPAAELFAQLTHEETQLLDSCAENLTKKIYSPEKAEQCLLQLDADDHRLLNKAMQDGDLKATRLMAGLNAVKDLGDFYRDAQGDYFILAGLTVRLVDASPCVLCSLDLGPQPDKLYPWVGKYAPDKLLDTKKASMDLGTLTPLLAAGLAQEGHVPATWASLTLPDRLRELMGFSSRKLNEILPRGSLTYDMERHDPLLKEIMPYLSAPQKQRLENAHSAMIAAAAAEKKAAEARGQTAAEAGKKYAALEKKLKALYGDTAGTSDFLNNAFDNASGQGEGAAGKKGKPQSFTLTEDQARRLSPRVQQALTGPDGELSDTPIGRDAIAFMTAPGGQLKFYVKRMQSDGTRGAFSPSRGDVSINLTYVEKAMRATNVTPEELMDPNNTTALKKVARYIAPTFMHEYEGHQEQTAWAVSKNIPDHYYFGQETEAFSKGSLFVLQKTQAELKKGNPWYSMQISESDVNMARLLKAEGPGGIGRSVMYYTVPSREGQAAQTFAEYEHLKKELTSRQILAEADPAGEAAREADRAYSTRDLKKRFDAIYPWYKESLKKSAEETRYFQKHLNDVDNEEKTNFWKYVMPDVG
jgi:hypothetical protein